MNVIRHPGVAIVSPFLITVVACCAGWALRRVWVWSVELTTPKPAIQLPPLVLSPEDDNV